ncbi:MAG: hypothetical protein RI964_2030 [Pseudomonadota bacterium]|jgi:Cu2+-exporting ATPase
MPNVVHPTSNTECFHCKTPLPKTAKLTILMENQHHRVCCYGCKAVAEALMVTGYYQNRAQAHKPHETKELTYETH